MRKPPPQRPSRRRSRPRSPPRSSPSLPPPHPLPMLPSNFRIFGVRTRKCGSPRPRPSFAAPGSLRRVPYDYVLMKLPEDAVMSVRAQVSAIEADPVKQETSYHLLKEALLGSYGKTKWQMAYALLDHPDLGDRRPSSMMAEMLSLRFETSAPDSLFLALFLRRLPDSIRDHLAAANHATATEMATHTDVLWDARNTASISAVSDSLAAMSVCSASPDSHAKSPDRRSRSPERRCDNGRPTPGRWDNKKFCHYHRTYGPKALKCQGPCEWAENALGGLLFLQDSVSKQQFLADTGAAVSVFPHWSPAASSGPLLSGADGKPISAWGKVTKKLNFGYN
jgi:hypothetical protein